MRTALLLLNCILLAACQSLPAKPLETLKDPQAVQILVLGTYHFGNPGADLNNAEAADIRTADRQAELEALMDALAKFDPNVVAIEASGTPPYVDAGYSDFRAAPREMLRADPGETVQIGYRLAHKMGIDRVFAVDEQPSEGEPDYFPFSAVSELAKANSASEALDKISDASALINAFEAAQETRTIPELLMMWNGGNKALESFYWNVIAFGDGETQPGAELAGYWFMRNTKIFNKITQVTEPGDRVVVIFGAGHAYWLSEIADKMDGYEFEPVLPYLEQAQTTLNTQ